MGLLDWLFRKTPAMTIYATHDVGALSRLKHPIYSWCKRCGVTWADIGDNHHTIYYTEGHGCFPTCEPCWQASNLDERLAYVSTLIQMWKKDYETHAHMWKGQPENYDETHKLIEAVVRKEWEESHVTE